MIVIKGKSGKALLALKYATTPEVLIVESAQLTLSKMIHRDGVYALQLPDNSREQIEGMIDILTYGFENDMDMYGTRVIFYLNTTLECLPMIEEFEKKFNLDVIVTLQTDGEVGEFTI